MQWNDEETELLFEFEQIANREKKYRFLRPRKVIAAERTAEVIPALEQVRDAVKRGWYAAGFLSYEAAPAFDPAYRTLPRSEMPLLWFGIYEAPEPPGPELPASAAPYRVGAWEPDTGRQAYDACIERIRQEIREGNTYQVNYTVRFRTDFAGDEFALYRKLTRAQRSGYAAYLNIGRYRVLSASPELFFHWKGRRITARPMKGTAKRGLSVREDETRKEHLRTSAKERAENVMITDLLRNDLGRIAERGSVHVPRLLEIEQYPTVYQMTSTVQAELSPEADLVDVFRALFPCGSITGAPKISTMNLIAGLERTPREVYCGAIGYVTPEGEACFSVPIRTVIIDKEEGTARYGAGGGITWDSSADGEYREILAKASLLHEEEREFELLETMLLAGGEYRYLERHLSRMRGSAAYFNYPFAEAEIRKRLRDLAAEYPSDAGRVRLLLSGSGKITLESVPFVPLAKTEPLPVSLAREAIDRGNRFYYHKTTDRTIYETYREGAPDVFDVLLWNEKGEVTEFTIGNVVAEIGGRKYTPPVRCGLLPGTFREALLARGEIEERVITREEVPRASRLWLINSVQGWVPAALR